MTTLSPRAIAIIATVLALLSAAIGLVTSGAITLDVQVQEPTVEAAEAVETPVEAPAEPTEAPALADPIPLPAETQVVDEAADAPSADAPSADLAVEASGG